jgi:[acyl-carrier-protein] S-malonyltransferase
VEIESHIPMHTALFRPAAIAFREHLQRAKFERPRLPYLSNVSARFESHERIGDLLELHVHSPVLWRESIDFLSSSVRDPVFVEVGPRSILCNLLSRSWTKHPRHRTDVEALDAAIQELSRAA